MKHFPFHSYITPAHFNFPPKDYTVCQLISEYNYKNNFCQNFVCLI